MPAYSPERNPVERIRLYLRERFLSHRHFDNYDAIVDAACTARQCLIGEVGRTTSLCAYPSIDKLLRAAVKT